MEREARYKELLTELDALMDKEAGEVANLANAAAILHAAFDFHWTGFYLVRNGLLCLGPFQGPVACTRIEKGRGVCGTAWENAAPINVPDVNAFPGHIACSPLSRSELVLPLFRSSGDVYAVLDIDNSLPDYFSETDMTYLEEFNRILSTGLGI